MPTASVSDQAANQDALGFEPYVTAIAQFLTSPQTKPPLTLSVEGEWGSGKSSFMRQLQAEIEQIERSKNKPAPKVVWFNAWRHDKVEALWAAFALEFLRQISRTRTPNEVLPTVWRHWKLFWMRLNWRENWQDFARIVSLSLFFGSLALTLPALFFTIGLRGVNEFSEEIVCRLSPENQTENEDSDSKASSNPQQACPDSGSLSEGILNLLLLVGGFAGSATGVLTLLLKLREIVGDPKNDLKQYLESPDYEGQVAFIEQFHEDFEKIVSAYAGKGNKVYVFIDDLDRCELTKAGELMQGLNLLISNDPHLIFILGMDREKVAAGIALKQKDVLPYLPDASAMLKTSEQDSLTASKALEYGYAFIEKFIQLPFQVPQPAEANLETFLESILDLKQKVNKERTEPAKGPNVLALLRERINSMMGRRQTSPLVGSTSKTRPNRQDLAVHPSQNNLQSIIDEELKSDNLKEIGVMVAPALDYNPRRLKLFINSIRLKAYIAQNTGYRLKEDDESSQFITLEQLGKFTAISLKWHLLMMALKQDSQLLKSLQQYALDRKASIKEPSASDNGKEGAIPEGGVIQLSRWHRDRQLIKLLQAGCIDKDGNRKPDCSRYSLEEVDFKKLLEVSPRVVKRSKAPVSYVQLEQFLKARDWKAADAETYQLMITAVGKEKGQWFEEEELLNFPCEELQAIDGLWVKYSNGHFGFSAQKRIYIECGAEPDGKCPNQEIWNNFGNRVGWRKDGEWLDYDNFNLSLSSTQVILPCWWGPAWLGWWWLFSRTETCGI